MALRDWLKAHRVTQVAMEATGVYWKPVWAMLGDEFDCLLVNARHVKQAPGRTTDVSNTAWLCQLLEAGLVRRSFVPPKPIRALRNLTRYRNARVVARDRDGDGDQVWREPINWPPWPTRFARRELVRPGHDCMTLSQL